MKITSTKPEMAVHVRLDDLATGPFGPKGEEAQASAFTFRFFGSQPTQVSVKATWPDGVERWRFIEWADVPPVVREHVEREVRERLDRPDREEAA